VEANKASFEFESVLVLEQKIAWSVSSGDLGFNNLTVFGWQLASSASRTGGTTLQFV
jgi:hypothetical protein